MTRSLGTLGGGQPLTLIYCGTHIASTRSVDTILKESTYPRWTEGIFPDDAVRLLHPLDEPSRIDSAVDVRRVRAFTISALEKTSLEGHTLQFAGALAEEIRETSSRPECPVTTDILTASVQELKPEVVASEVGGKLELQLSRYRTISKLVRKHVLGRVEGQRHAATFQWAELLQEKWGTTDEEVELQARTEKTAALTEIAASRFAVLSGPAGAGKTSVLGLLCDQEEIGLEGILLLAPTGKARVRMQELAGGAGNSSEDHRSVPQQVRPLRRGDRGRYHMSDRPKATGFATVIIDEASMLTEDMLGALLDALQGVQRLILVGDPAQLPRDRSRATIHGYRQEAATRRLRVPLPPSSTRVCRAHHRAASSWLRTGRPETRQMVQHDFSDCR